MNKNIPLEEKISNLEKEIKHDRELTRHDLKIVINSLEQIKKHIWNSEGDLDEPSDEGTKENTKYLKKQAINYIHNVVLPDIKAVVAEHEGEIGAQGLWDFLIAQLAQPVFEKIKTSALEYIGNVITELKKQAIPYAVKVADWLLDKLENIIVAKYNETSQEDQEQFKEAIKEHFPSSRLLGKLN